MLKYQSLAGLFTATATALAATLTATGTTLALTTALSGLLGALATATLITGTVLLTATAYTLALLSALLVGLLGAALPAKPCPCSVHLPPQPGIELAHRSDSRPAPTGSVM